MASIYCRTHHEDTKLAQEALKVSARWSPLLRARGSELLELPHAVAALNKHLDETPTAANRHVRFSARLAVSRLAAAEHLHHTTFDEAHQLMGKFGHEAGDYTHEALKADDAQQAEQNAYRSLSGASFMEQDFECSVHKKSHCLRLEDAGRTIRVEETVTINRSVAHAQHCMDAQNWTKCNSPPFHDSYICDEYPMHPPPPRTPPPLPEPCKEWERRFYENFVLVPGLLEYQNILWINCWKPPEQGKPHELHFRLESSQFSKLWGSNGPFGLERDDGRIAIQENEESKAGAPKTDVTGIKHLRFQNRPPTLFSIAIPSDALVFLTMYFLKYVMAMNYDNGLCCSPSGGSTHD
jgi:hypothetical protein